MKINIPEGVQEILVRLELNGFEGYIVGGCVRDSLLNKSPKDWDITTNATPIEMQQVFKDCKVIETGLKHGTLTIVLNGENYEVTTYRADGEYVDNRRPSDVSFVKSLEEDLLRRDFTINAIAYNPKVGLVDFFNGVEDLQNKRIKVVGDSDLRFKEDALRILRALRFSSVLGFDIEEDTSKYLFLNKDLLENISAERKNMEFTKLLQGDNVVDILLKYRDIIAEFIPECKPTFDFEQENKYHMFDVWEHIVRTVGYVPKEYKLIRLSAFFHDIGKPQAFSRDERGGHFYSHPKFSEEITEKVLTRLRFSNDEKDMILTLVKYHDVEINPTRKFVLKMYNKIGKENLKSLMILKEADITSHSNYDGKQDNIDKVKKVLELIEELELEEKCFTLKDLAINGDDLQKELNLKPSKQIGFMLNSCLQEVLDERIVNNKDELLSFCKKLMLLNSNRHYIIGETIKGNSIKIPDTRTVEQKIKDFNLNYDFTGMDSYAKHTCLKSTR